MTFSCFMCVYIQLLLHLIFCFIDRWRTTTWLNSCYNSRGAYSTDVVYCDVMLRCFWNIIGCVIFHLQYQIQRGPVSIEGPKARQLNWAWKKVSMIRKHHNQTPQTNPRHHKEESHDIRKVTISTDHKTKCWEIKTFLPFIHSDVVFIMIINVKCQQLLGPILITIFYRILCMCRKYRISRVSLNIVKCHWLEYQLCVLVTIFYQILCIWVVSSKISRDSLNIAKCHWSRLFLSYTQVLYLSCQ